MAILHCAPAQLATDAPPVAQPTGSPLHRVLLSYWSDYEVSWRREPQKLAERSLRLHAGYEALALPRRWEGFDARLR
jgi:hypothetical protein